MALSPGQMSNDGPSSHADVSWARGVCSWKGTRDHPGSAPLATGRSLPGISAPSATAELVQAVGADRFWQTGCKLALRPPRVPLRSLSAALLSTPHTSAPLTGTGSPPEMRRHLPAPIPGQFIHSPHFPSRETPQPKDACLRVCGSEPARGPPRASRPRQALTPAPQKAAWTCTFEARPPTEGAQKLLHTSYSVSL